jgi:glycosyltransferase involved in cell wall biosynthesis
VTVRPVLRFKPTYPEPYESAPYHLADIITTLAEAARDHDRFYIHDAELLFPFVHEDVATTVAVQDFVYPTTLAGALPFRGDHLVVTSPYVRRCVDAVFDRFRPLPPDRVSVVCNGFDLDRMRRTESASLRREIGLAGDDIAVLYPHRPDPRKGAAEAVDTVLHVTERLPAAVAARVRLVVPQWMDTEQDSDGAESYRQGYAAMVRRAADAGRPDLVHLHGWVPTARMPAYYSLGVASLCVGNFIEAFGNSSVESLLCGTPAIISRVGAQRTVLPDRLTHKIDHGDVKTAADILTAVIQGEAESHDAEIREYVATHYSLDAMVRGYADAILGTRSSAPLPAYVPPPAITRLDIPPWCADLATGYYNDYHHGYVDDPRLRDVVAQLADGPADATVVPAELREAWLQDGHLIGWGDR